MINSSQQNLRSRTTGHSSVRESLRTGFTLVELLVVTGVIILLIAMLLSALLQARETAAAAECRTRLRQFFPAWQKAKTNHVIVNSSNWQNSLLEYTSRDLQIFHCTRDFRPAPPDGMAKPVGFGMNNGFHVFINGDDDRIAMLDYNSITPHVANVTGITGTDPWPQVYALRHRGRINVLFFGGATEAKEYWEIDPTYYSIHDRLWRPSRTFQDPDSKWAKPWDTSGLPE